MFVVVLRYDRRQEAAISSSGIATYASSVAIASLLVYAAPPAPVVGLVPCGLVFDWKVKA